MTRASKPQKSETTMTKSSKTSSRNIIKVSQKSKPIKKKPTKVESKETAKITKNKILALQSKIVKLQKQLKVEKKDRKKTPADLSCRNSQSISSKKIKTSQVNSTTIIKKKRPVSSTRETRCVKKFKSTKPPKSLKRPTTEISKKVPRKVKPNPVAEEDKVGEQVAYIHVGEGGECDLSDHLAASGSSKLHLQILEEERLPDLDCSDLIHGLDQRGTSRDYVEETHRCSNRCPVGCQGHLRPNEVVVCAGWKQGSKLTGRTRWRGRFVSAADMDTSEKDDVVLAELDMGPNLRRIGGRGKSGPSTRSRGAGNQQHLQEAVLPVRTRQQGVLERNMRRALHQQRFRRVMEEDRNDTPIPPLPQRLGEMVPQRVQALLDSPVPSLEMSTAHSWNPNDRSFNVELKAEDPLVMRRRPVAQSTDCIRAKVGYSEGLHLFEINWPVRQRGTHAVVGIADATAQLHAQGYTSLIGSNDQSWGWDLGRKKAFHGGNSQQFPLSISHHHQWTVPETFQMLLNMDRGVLMFLAEGEMLGVSHTGLPKDKGPLFPAVSTVWGHCEVKLQYMGSLYNNSPLSLQELSRLSIRGAIVKNKQSDCNVTNVEGRTLKDLGLPKPLQNFLAYLDLY